jgi:type I restriction enzyme R subunit
MDNEGIEYLKLVSHPFDDKRTDKLLEVFKDKSQRAEFFKLYKQLETLYEIISPDQFLLPFIGSYKTLSSIYAIIRNAFVKRVYADKEFMRKTENLIKDRTEIYGLSGPTNLFEINERTIEEIKKNNSPDNFKVINLIKSIDKSAIDDPEDLILLSMKQKAEAIQENYEDRQITTGETLSRLESLLKKTVEQKKEQAEKQFDDITYFVYLLLVEKKRENPDEIARSIREAFIRYPYWKDSEAELIELRKHTLFALLNSSPAVSDEDAISFIDSFFSYLLKAYKI